MKKLFTGMTGGVQYIFRSPSFKPSYFTPTTVCRIKLMPVIAPSIKIASPIYLWYYNGKAEKGNKMIKTIILLLSLTTMTFAGVKEAIQAMKDGDYKTAYKEYSALAEAGDDIAMISCGLMFHRGQGFKQDYSIAMDWYIKAFRKYNGDAYSNIGVMYRDGLSVKKDKRMAYCLFLITHMRGLGTESTQFRANSCLRRIVPQMSKEDVIACLDYTEEYIRAFVIAKGDPKEIRKTYKASKEHIALKDKNWWLKGELPSYIKTTQ